MSVGTSPGAPRVEPRRTERRAISLFRADIVKRALIDSFAKLDPRVQIRNPVMFVVEIGAVVTTVTWFIQVFGGKALGAPRLHPPGARAGAHGHQLPPNARSRARLSSSTLTPVSPENPSPRPCVYWETRLWTRDIERCRSAATR